MRVVGLAAVLAAALGTACAKIEPPPGGPPDTAPPRLVAVVPESVQALPGYRGSVEFRFDEVISEGGTPSNGSGNGDLERLVILSPTTRVPDVSWKRSRIEVRPREGWLPDRTYRVELLPGVSDLRNNRATSARAVVTFTTGGPRPVDTLRGMVRDWTTGQPVPRALVEALLLPDSLSYRLIADSAGRFAAAPMPAGTYLVYGVIDQNNNHMRELREAFDSATVAAPGAGAELWTFPHDTNPPRLREATASDSVTVRLQFTQPLLPGQPIDTGVVTVRHLPDSATVAVAMLVTQAAYDSIQASTPRDSLAPKAPADTAPKPARPTLSDRLVLKLVQPMDTAGQYLVMIRGVRNVTGVAADSAAAVFKAPAPRPAPAAVPDSLAPADSLAKPTDNQPPPPSTPDSPPASAVPDQPRKP